MKIVICGAGNVGLGLAHRLSSERNDVSVIDSSDELVRRVSDTLDVRGFFGHGSDPDTLHRAGAPDAEMIIAVTRSDEVNMVACQVAHSLFKIPTKMARIRAQGYLQDHWSDLFSRQNMPIDVVISPERAVSEAILQRLLLPGASDVLSFCGGAVSVVGVICGEEGPVVGKSLAKLTKSFPEFQATVVGIARGGEIFVPRGSDHMLAGDEAYVATPTDQVRGVLSIFGHGEERAHRIIISGGGNIGAHVARSLEGWGAHLKIIEESRERAIQIADGLSRTVVLQGSSLDEGILREASVDRAEIFLALTNNDQVNVMSAAMVRHLGCENVIVLVNNPSYPSLLHSLGIDAYVDPRAVTVSKVLKHIRRGRILSVHTVRAGQAEILEAEALETSPLLGRALRELDLPVGVRIGAIHRGGKVLSPCGDTRIQPHDRVVVLSLASEVQRVEQLFRVGFEFF